MYGPLACGLCYARGKSTCKSNLFGSYKGDLKKGEEQVSGRWWINIPDALTLKYSETCHRTVILSYLVGPTILICNLDVLKNATLSVLSVLSGEGPRKGEVVHLIMDPNPL